MTKPVWSVVLNSTAASSAQLSFPTSTAAGRLKEPSAHVYGASWSFPKATDSTTALMSTSVFAIYLDGNSSAAFIGAGCGSVENLHFIAGKSIEAKWLSSSPGGSVMAATVWGWWD